MGRGMEYRSYAAHFEERIVSEWRSPPLARSCRRSVRSSHSFPRRSLNMDEAQSHSSAGRYASLRYFATRMLFRISLFSPHLQPRFYRLATLFFAKERPESRRKLGEMIPGSKLTSKDSVILTLKWWQIMCYLEYDKEWNSWNYVWILR